MTVGAPTSRSKPVIPVAYVEKMLTVSLEKYGVDHDGWGTYFQE